MTRTSAISEGVATDKMVEYHANFARGGLSLIITEGTYPDKKYSQGYNNQPRITDNKQVQARKFEV
jgi:2,4-dienoyl-CoA reductase-like NADH-dependent reductase (Old Yellow Enzyme family)